MRRRPAAAGGRIRRPAARVAVLTPEQYAKNYEKGTPVEAHQVPAGTFQSGDWIQVLEGTYYQKATEVVGKVVREQIESQERESLVEATGTQSEELLKHCSSLAPGVAHLRLHLCQVGCNALRANPDLLHITRLKKIKEPAKGGWETNLEQEKEMEALAADHERWKEEQETKEKEEKEKKEKKAKKDSSTSEEKKKKKKKKEKKKAKKKEKKEEKEKEKKEKSEDSPEERETRLGGKAVARKPLEDCYTGTGMDPSYRRRRRLARKVKKTLKKAKDGSTSTASSGETGETDEEMEPVMDDRNRIHRIHSMAPGLLASTTLTAMQPHVLALGGGMWSKSEHSLEPVVSQYHRHFLSPRMAGAMAREVTTLSWLSDLLIQGRIAEGLDVAMQRLKSLEMTASGTPWSQSAKIELAPDATPAMSSRAEVQVAMKEAKLDFQTRGTGGGDKGNGKGKTKDKGKGKNKDAKGKQKDADQKK